ncbi:MAG: hypothetical protein VCG02_10845 [Verrucomicrobiota bacterium]
MSTADPFKDIKLPESLLRKLQEFETRLRRMETVVTVCGALFGLLLTYGILFLSDRLWDTPAWLRVVLTLTGTAGFAWFSYRWLQHWYFKRRDSRDMAKMIQRHYKRLGDRLLGVVELAEGRDRPENVSPALCRAAIKQVAGEAEKYDFEDAVNRSRPRNFSVASAAILFIVIVPFVMFPTAGKNALIRWLAPFAQVERYTFVNLEDLPDHWIVPHGETFEIPCKVSDRSKRMPSFGYCKFKGQPRIENDVNDGKVVFKIPGQTRQGVLSIRLGDVLKEITVIPHHRPELLELQAWVNLPEYIKRTAYNQPIEGGRAEFLEGSSVRFSGRVSRNLAEIHVTGSEEAVLSLRKESFSSETLAADNLERLAFAWKDEYGLSSVEPFELDIATIEDKAPDVDARGISRAIAILEDEVVNMDITATDDYGIKKVYMKWDSEGNRENGIPEIHGSQAIAEGSPTHTQVVGKFSFSPITAHIPEDSVVTLRAYATDYKPNRPASLSDRFRIYVLNRATHAKLIRDQMEAVQARIEDLVRDEEALVEQNEELKQQDEPDLGNQKSGDELGQNEQSEKRNQGTLKELARDTDNLIMEGLRNRDIPAETLREWTEMSEQMKNLVKNQMNEAVQSLGQASRNPGERKENLAAAIEKEKEIIEQLEKMEKEVNDSIENMLAKNFINRLKQAAELQDDISRGLRDILPRTIGLAAKDLQDDEREQIDLIASREGTNRREAGYIQEDLSGFYNRTRKEDYKKIYDEMVELNMLVSLEKLADAIADNVGGQSIRDSERWKGQFTQWADYLSSKAGGGGGGGGGGEAQEINLEILIGLLRARQTEQDIRDQTRLLENSREQNRQYRRDSRKLSIKQYESAAEIAKLEAKAAALPPVKKLIQKVGGEMMNAGMQLRKPVTGSETIAVETEIIELLTAACSSCSGYNSSTAAMLMSMLGMAPGAGLGMSGGGNPSGGEATGEPDGSAGQADGATGEQRGTDRAAGIDPAEFPDEFRDALEGYFNALEGVN